MRKTIDERWNRFKRTIRIYYDPIEFSLRLVINEPSLYPPLIVSHQTINLATNNVHPTLITYVDPVFLVHPFSHKNAYPFKRLLAKEAIVCRDNAIIGRDIIGMEIFRGTNGHEAGPDPPRGYTAKIRNNIRSNNCCWIALLLSEGLAGGRRWLKNGVIEREGKVGEMEKGKIMASRRRKEGRPNIEVGEQGRKGVVIGR